VGGGDGRLAHPTRDILQKTVIKKNEFMLGGREKREVKSLQREKGTGASCWKFAIGKGRANLRFNRNRGGGTNVEDLTPIHSKKNAMKKRR